MKVEVGEQPDATVDAANLSDRKVRSISEMTKCLATKFEFRRKKNFFPEILKNRSRNRTMF